MTKTFLLAGLLISFLICQAQQRLPLSLVKRIPVVYDSVITNTDRQKSLSAYHASASREQKNILVFSSTARNTKDQEVLFIGKLEKKEVYKVNLSAVTSKYIAETEKNLGQLFTDAAQKHWVLFFDNADELFGKSKQPESTANYIQILAQSKNVLAIFWCEDDCLKWLKKSRYVLVQ